MFRSSSGSLEGNTSPIVSYLSAGVGICMSVRVFFYLLFRTICRAFIAWTCFWTHTTYRHLFRQQRWVHLRPHWPRNLRLSSPCWRITRVTWTPLPRPLLLPMLPVRCCCSGNISIICSCSSSNNNWHWRNISWHWPHRRLLRIINKKTR